MLLTWNSVNCLSANTHTTNWMNTEFFWRNRGQGSLNTFRHIIYLWYIITEFPWQQAMFYCLWPKLHTNAVWMSQEQNDSPDTLQTPPALITLYSHDQTTQCSWSCPKLSRLTDKLISSLLCRPERGINFQPSTAVDYRGLLLKDELAVWLPTGLVSVFFSS